MIARRTPSVGRAVCLASWRGVDGQRRVLGCDRDELCDGNGRKPPAQCVCARSTHAAPSLGRYTFLTVPQIDGHEEIVSRLGMWPSFHDAEVLAVHINRDAPSTMLLRVMHPPATVQFTFSNIADLSLAGEEADGQNVISCLFVDDDPLGTRIMLGPCYGLAGYLVVEKVRVDLMMKD